ncbi:MAG: hypothetical protein JXB42_01690 [Deltaproteobacteria bacterium]|nr:hypothetical protein [Deltaproteobacteria bacterium]
MSTGSIVGAVVGGAIGFAIGGPTGAMYGAAIGFGLGMYIDPATPDVATPGNPLQSELQIMTNSVGTPILDALGAVKITGNLLWFGLERSVAQTQTTKTGKGGGSETTTVTGYKYYMSWAMGLCLGPVDTLYAVYKNDDVVWEGKLDRPGSGGEETIVLTGMGSLTFYFGTSDQAANSTLGAALNDPTLNPPYRGLCWAFFNDCYIGDYNRAPTMKFVLKKEPTCPFDSDDSFKTIQILNYNPVHAIWYILNTLTGLSSSWLSEADFLTAAETVCDEARGISLLFDRSQPALAYIENINNHIDALLRYDIDAKFHPKLLREDYAAGDLLSVDEDNLLEDPTFARKSWIETINEIKVQYTEIINFEEVFCSCEEVSIGYTTQGMSADEEQELTVVGAVEGCVYNWAIASGGGSLSAETGISVTYTAPHTNPNCEQNPTITLSCGGEVCDTLEIVINAYGVDADVAYWKVDSAITEDCYYYDPDRYFCLRHVYMKSYNCKGEYLGIIQTWGGSVAPWFTYSCDDCYSYMDDNGLSEADVWASVAASGYSAGEIIDKRTGPMTAAGCCAELLL